MGFAIPLLKISFDFLEMLFQGLTMYLLISVRWPGGGLLASLLSN
jgi:hypothetical protein